jgi:hypothetical protein
MRHFRGWANPPTILAALALFVALGGSSFAAPARDAAKKLISGKSIKNNSISSTDIKNNSLASGDVKNNSLASGDVKNGSLLSKDFKAGQLPAGATGARGLTGATGSVGRLTYVVENTAVDGDDTSATTLDVPCPNGQFATGGSAYTSGALRVVGSAPDTGLKGGWRGDALGTPGNDGELVVFALCAAGPLPAFVGNQP